MKLLVQASPGGNLTGLSRVNTIVEELSVSCFIQKQANRLSNARENYVT